MLDFPNFAEPAFANDVLILKRFFRCFSCIVFMSLLLKVLPIEADDILEAFLLVEYAGDLIILQVYEVII